MTSRTPPTEKELQAAVIELARRLGWLVAHFHDSRREVRPGVFVGDKDAAGFPDLVLVHHSHGIKFRELKSATGKLTPAQKEWHFALNVAGVDADVWRPSDWPQRIALELEGRA